MKTILKQLGYSLSETRESLNNRKLTLFYIPNTDGSVRWVWPEHVKTPLFLKFYAVSGFRSRLFSLAVTLVFLLRLQPLVFRKSVFYITAVNQNAADFDIDALWSLFKGTIGPNNKSIVYLEKNGISGFIKVANTEKAKTLIEREATVLNRLYLSNVESFTFPEVYESTANLLLLSDVSKNARRTSHLSNAHIDALIELNELTSVKMPLCEIEGWNKLKKDITALTTHEDNRLPKGMIRKLARLIKQINENEEIEVCLSHGDFTSWNMFVKNDRLHLYDWELADPFKPLGFDLFHFIIQQGILVDHKSWSAIKQDIDQHINCESFLQLSKFKSTNSKAYLKLYLVFNVSYYLKLYAEQAVWHHQVYWLFNVWNEALSELAGNSINHRELVLMDMFDFLLEKNYATIKSQNTYPEKINQFSDVDICADKSVNTELRHYLKNHPLVNSLHEVSKSFMSTQQMTFKNGDRLSIDLIWNIKRKGLEILDAKAVLKSAYINSYGVKTLDVYDNARYIGLFYTLNNKPIPDKYNYYEEILSTSTSLLDKQLFPCFIDQTADKSNLLNFIKKQKSNKWLKGFINQLNYVLDCLKMPFKNSGTIITFSGVDGAGKSTVIEVLKYKVEKQLRKRVVVLRHRPSIFPILSAWKKGKTAAEQESVMNLPRLGTNKSMLSSLLRFSYYYMDYLIGQFLVHVKYTWRGYIVIYDRYYFDFMNDSKRSNILLPKFIFEAGFKFLMKPQFNFFLYADPATILNRKQELNKEAIETLTARYLNQFNELNLKDTSATYLSIKNIHLHETVHTVFDTIAMRNAA